MSIGGSTFNLRLTRSHGKFMSQMRAAWKLIGVRRPRYVVGVDVAAVGRDRTVALLQGPNGIEQIQELSADDAESLARR